MRSRASGRSVDADEDADEEASGSDAFSGRWWGWEDDEDDAEGVNEDEEVERGISSAGSEIIFAFRVASIGADAVEDEGSRLADRVDPGTASDDSRARAVVGSETSGNSKEDAGNFKERELGSLSRAPSAKLARVLISRSTPDSGSGEGGRGTSAAVSARASTSAWNSTAPSSSMPARGSFSATRTRTRDAKVKRGKGGRERRRREE